MMSDINKDHRVYIISEKKEKRNTAGAKAPSDVISICRQAGYEELRMPQFPRGRSKVYQKAWLLISGTYNWLKVKRAVEDDIVIYQHPMYGNRLMKKMNRRSRAIGFAVYLDMLNRLEVD